MKPISAAKRKTWHLVLKIGIGLLLIVLIAGIIVNRYLNTFIANHLKDAVSKSSNGLYILNFKNVEANIFTRKISIHEAELHIDSPLVKKMTTEQALPHYLVEGKFPTIQLAGIHWMRMIFSKNLTASSLILASPNITLSQMNGRNDSVKKTSPAKAVSNIDINNIHIEDANLEYRNVKATEARPTIYRVEKIRVDVSGLAINNNSSTAGKNPFDKIEVEIAAYEYRTSDSLYIMGFRNFQYSSESGNGKIAQLYIRPRLSENDYAHKLSFQKERNEISFENVRLENIGLNETLDTGEINIKNVDIGSGHWNIYLNRIPPLPPPRKKVVPSQTLLSIPQPVHIATMRVNKFQLDYREYNTATEETGQIKFNDISGTVTNITNEKNVIDTNPHLVADLDARLMGTGKFHARFDFLLSDSAGRFSVAASLGQMDAQLLNPAFIPLDKVEIKKGTIDELRCTGNGNEDAIHGNVSMLYHDLHIAVMEKDKQADTMKPKTVTSMVANIFVKNDNPKKDEPVRVANNISLRRDARKSYFNMLWMALFTGIVKIASGK